MGETSHRKWPQRLHSVRDDWLAWLPAEKDKLFDETSEQLELRYGMLSVTLNEAFSLRTQSTLEYAREQAAVSADLFDFLATRLVSALGTIEAHGRHFGTLPNVAPLKPAFFRGEPAQSTAWRSGLLSMVLFSSRSKFFHKLHAMVSIVVELQKKFREAAEEIAAGASLDPDSHWTALDVLHYDLNTCLREAIVLLKSFLLALPSEELSTFGQKLEAPAEVPHAVRDRRATPFRRE